MKDLDKYEQKLLEGWEEVYKRGQLTFGILLALKEGPKHMNDIKVFMSEITDGSLSADDKSMYRALRRYKDADMVDFMTEPGKSGPELKVYRLTPTGGAVLEQFVERNITNVFNKPRVRALLERSA